MSALSGDGEWATNSISAQVHLTCRSSEAMILSRRLGLTVSSLYMASILNTYSTERRKQNMKATSSFLAAYQLLTAQKTG